MPSQLMPSQARAARALLNWSQDELAEAANIGVSTIKDFEAGRRDPADENLRAMVTALRKAGVGFLELDASGGPGVRLAAELPKITHRPKEVDFVTDNLIFRVRWRDDEIFVMLPANFLDDIDGPSYDGNEEYLAAFAKHEKLILKRTAQALYSGRTDAKGRLQLRKVDFKHDFRRA